MFNRNIRRIGLLLLLSTSMLLPTGCSSNTAGGDLEEDAFEEYTLDGANLAKSLGISSSSNDETDEEKTETDTTDVSETEAVTETENQTETEETADTADIETADAETEATIAEAAESDTDFAESEESETDIPETETEEIADTEVETETETETEDDLAGITAVAQVENWVNVRVEPTTESGIVGKIYNNCAATILDEVEGEDGTWYYMTSGNVTGYIKAEFFVIGEEAEALKDEIGLVFARVIVENLRVRSTPDLTVDDNIITMYPMGTEVAVLSYDDEWALIETDASSTGYVHVSCIEMWTEFDVAITLEEEAAAEAAAQAAAEAAAAAEAEYLALLAQQEAESIAAEEASKAALEAEAAAEAQAAADAAAAAEAQAAAEAAAAAETAAAETTAETEATTTVTTSDVNAALRAAIVAYALQFEGCPYVHAGRSLTNGTDCSGFTALVYQNFGYTLSWSPSGQSVQGVQIDYHDVQPGDLLFYSNSEKYLGHVALYIGDGKIIHAANEQYGICIWDMNYREPLFAVSIIN